MHTNAEQRDEASSSAQVEPRGMQEGAVDRAFLDLRPQTVAQRQHRSLANGSARLAQQRLGIEAVQRKADEAHVTPNRTGLPDRLKVGIESLSGISMDGVKVHYNSAQPAQLNAHAYAQGTDIHIAPGQERYLPHEAWHVVQQAQGRVAPTIQLHGDVHGNDDHALEGEADVMGNRAMECASAGFDHVGGLDDLIKPSVEVRQMHIVSDRLNIAGEDHSESNQRRDEEIAFCAANAGGKYWREEEFTIDVSGVKQPADPEALKFLFALQTIANAVTRLITHETESNQKSTLANFPMIHEFLMPLIVLAERHWEQAEGVGYPGPLSAEQLAERDARLGTRFASLQALKTALQDLRLMVGTPLNKENMLILKTKYTAIAGAREIMVENLMEKIHIDKLRSRAMHLAGQNRFEIKGVWKIGENHVTDIAKEFPGDQRAYHLLTQQEFNDALSEFNPGQSVEEVHDI